MTNATKIAAADAAAMNRLLGQELSASGVKIAADEKIEAFKDHAEYVSVLETVLSDDKKDGWEPNDPKLD
jgi:hypothetical protein